MRPPEGTTRLRTAMILLIVGAVPLAGCFPLPASTAMRLRNTGSQSIRIWGCVDPDVGIGPHSTVTLDIPSVRPEWCEVLDSHNRYIGCLPVNIDAHAAVDVRAALVARDERRCSAGAVTNDL